LANGSAQSAARWQAPRNPPSSHRESGGLRHRL